VLLSLPLPPPLLRPWVQLGGEQTGAAAGRCAQVVLADASSGRHGDPRVAVGAFVMPNAPIESDTPLSAFVVPLEQLEDAVGAQALLQGCRGCGAAGLPG
jgi:hypothetical protein